MIEFRLLTFSSGEKTNWEHASTVISTICQYHLQKLTIWLLFSVEFLNISHLVKIQTE